MLLAPAQLAKAQQVDSTNWGGVTAPVYGTSEKGAYSSAELLAGPNKFGQYYAGVLPNGRMVKPAGVSAQIGMDPLGIALTPDGKYLITSNADEREGGYPSYQSKVNLGGYSLSVVDTTTMTTVAQYNASGRFYIGLQVTGAGPYTIWASGGPDNDVKLFTMTTDGKISPGSPASIPIAPITPATSGYVSNYTPGAALQATDANGNMPPVPSGFDRVNGAKITFPAGSALSPDGKFLYVACNGDNSVAVIDTTAMSVVKQVPVGYFPYGVSVSADGDRVLVSNWGVTAYRFWRPSYDASGNLISVPPAVLPGVDGMFDLGTNLPDGFYVPATDTMGTSPKTSSVSVLYAPGANGAKLAPLGAVYMGHTLDPLYLVGDTHPSATAIVRHGALEFLYVAKTNSDSLGVILLHNFSKMPDVDLSPLAFPVTSGQPPVHGSYPNALVVSPDNTRLYVAEAGINSVAVLDITLPTQPVLVGRIPTGWYPTAVAISRDGGMLYVANAKGIGEDINPNIDPTKVTPAPTGLTSDTNTDSNYIFGSVQQVNLAKATIDNTSVLANNFAVNPPSDTSVVPTGGQPSGKIKHVFFILHENKTFDSMLGSLGSVFGPFASTSFSAQDGTPYASKQYTCVSLNTQLLASKFATAVNYYSESEESDAGHQFCASGTSSDYTQKTLLVKTGRGLLVNKNFEPEDYPEAGYIFNNAARHGVSFKDYGALVRIQGTDTGTSTPTTFDDLPSGLLGYPKLASDNLSLLTPLANLGDVDSETQGLGQSYFMALPVLAVLGGRNQNGEPRLDRNYPGYNFNISDQRRAQEFIADFDSMVAEGTLPQFLYIYQPNDHTGGVQAPNKGSVVNPATKVTAPNLAASAVQQVADGDIGLGMVVQHIMSSPVYYDPRRGEGSAIFITYDDAQSTLDHVHPHRTPLVVVSPYAKPAYLATRHYSTASIVKTEELLLGLPPNNYGDLFATDLRDMFQSAYNGITADMIPVTRSIPYTPSKVGRKIWRLSYKLDTSAPDRDSHRLGALARLSIEADDQYAAASKQHRLHSRDYKRRQNELYAAALKVVNGPHPRDLDD